MFCLCVSSAVLRGYAQEVESSDRRHLRDTPSSFSGHMGAGTHHQLYPSLFLMLLSLYSTSLPSLAFFFNSSYSSPSHPSPTLLPSNFPFFFFFFHLSRAGAPPLHGPPESSSTPPVHGALGQTDVQCLRRLMCHSSTCPKGTVSPFSVVCKFWAQSVGYRSTCCMYVGHSSSVCRSKLSRPLLNNCVYIA